MTASSPLRVLEPLAKFCAITAGLLLTFITMMTVVSVIGRDFFGKAITGDFELSAAACGAAVALFMPWCQCKRGNIIVDFFTSKASAQTQRVLDRIGAFILGCIMLLLAWRATLGGLSAFNAQSGSMILGFPEWIVYVFMVPPLALTGVIAWTQAFFGFAPNAQEDNPELAV
jgi:TRAP-type C4-dicarboxylate transport system permease small subunit